MQTFTLNLLNYNQKKIHTQVRVRTTGLFPAMILTLFVAKQIPSLRLSHSI